MCKLLLYFLYWSLWFYCCCCCCSTLCTGLNCSVSCCWSCCCCCCSCCCTLCTGLCNGSTLVMTACSEVQSCSPLCCSLSARTHSLWPLVTEHCRTSPRHHNFNTPENTRKQQCNPNTTIPPNGTVHHNCNVPIHTPAAHPETKQKTFTWKIKFYQVNYCFECTVFFFVNSLPIGYYVLGQIEGNERKQKA